MTGAWKFSVTPFFCVGIYQLVKRGPHTQQYYHSFQLDALHNAQCSFGLEYQKFVLVKVFLFINRMLFLVKVSLFIKRMLFLL